jgi:hypothetical protein
MTALSSPSALSASRPLARGSRTPTALIPEPGLSLAHAPQVGLSPVGHQELASSVLSPFLPLRLTPAPSNLHSNDNAASFN